jgi:hypothetical protein
MKHNTTEVVLSSPVNYFLGDQTHKTISKRFLKVFEFVMGLQYVLILSKANFLTCCYIRLYRETLSPGRILVYQSLFAQDRRINKHKRKKNKHEIDLN